jgi:hypothetical protein
MTWRPIIRSILAALGVLGAIAAVLSIGRAGIGWDSPVDARALLEVRAIPEAGTLAVEHESVQRTLVFCGIPFPRRVRRRMSS